MAATTGIGIASSWAITAERPGACGGLPNSVMSAPATNVRPSHHSTTALRLACRSRVLVPVPTVGGEEEARLRADLHEAGLDARHEIVDVEPIGVLDHFGAHGLEIVSMGRPAGNDPVLFEAAAAAGIVATRHLVPSVGTA